MESVLSKCHLCTCLIYLDDIVVFGKSVEELKSRLKEVFEKLVSVGN